MTDRDPDGATEPGTTEPELMQAIRDLLASRAATSSICPSDVARRVAPQNWRPLMEPVRHAAAGLVRAGEVEITQRGEVVDLGSVRGPIRIRLPRPRH